MLDLKSILQMHFLAVGIATVTPGQEAMASVGIVAVKALVIH